MLLLLRGANPLGAVAVASAGNFLGACTTYGVGAYGGRWLEGRVAPAGSAARLRAERAFERFGSWSLLLSWLPIVGDALCLVAGALRLGFGRFSVLVLMGKLGRYAIVAAAVVG